MEVIDVDARNETLRKITLLDYALHIAGLILSAGILSVVAVIINYIKRDDARGTIYESHMNWMIRTFWWALLWFVLSGVLTFVTGGLAAFLFFVVGLWFLYRMIKGLLRLFDNRPMPQARVAG